MRQLRVRTLMTRKSPQFAQSSSGQLTEGEITAILAQILRHSAPPNASSMKAAMFVPLTLGLCDQYFFGACAEMFRLLRVPIEVWKPLADNCYVQALKASGWQVEFQNPPGRLFVKHPPTPQETYASTIASLRTSVGPSVVPLCNKVGVHVGAAIFVRGLPGRPESLLIADAATVVAAEGLTIRWGGKSLNVSPGTPKDGLVLLKVNYDQNLTMPLPPGLQVGAPNQPLLRGEPVHLFGFAVKAVSPAPLLDNSGIFWETGVRLGATPAYNSAMQPRQNPDLPVIIVGMQLPQPVSFGTGLFTSEGVLLGVAMAGTRKIVAFRPVDQTVPALLMDFAMQALGQSIFVVRNEEGQPLPDDDQRRQ
jgi:hypothetical protein